MARGCSVCTLYTLNLLLFLIGAALLAAPLVACTELCHITASEIESLRFVKVLQVAGACLMLFSLFGCCLAKSGKKRYRCPYLTVLLVLVAAGGLAVAVDQGLFFEDLKTYDPKAPQKVQDAIDGLASTGMKTFYHDFANVFDAASCKVEPAGPHESKVSCTECEPIETAFSTCMEEWQPSPEADKYLAKCGDTFKGSEAHCDGECTQAFCQCAGVLGQAVEHYTSYFKYVLLGVGAFLFLLLVASICVQRKPEPVPEEQQQLGQVFIVPRNQPVLA